MTDPVFTAMATTLATQVATMAATGGKAGLVKLVQLVKDRFRKEPLAQAALESAEREPEDAARVDRLRMALELVCEADPEFAERLLSAWREAAPGQTAADGGNINNFTGRADTVHQAHTINITHGR